MVDLLNLNSLEEIFHLKLIEFTRIIRSLPLWKGRGGAFYSCQRKGNKITPSTTTSTSSSSRVPASAHHPG